MKTRKQLIEELKKYFDIRELVCPHTYKAFGEKAWQFFDVALLETLLELRTVVLERPMLINNYHKGGTFSQRGFRCNICDIPKQKTLKNLIYLSAHTNGAAVDFDASGLSAAQTRLEIKSKADLLTNVVRCEADVMWVHIDVYDSGNGKYSEFKG